MRILLCLAFTVFCHAMNGIAAETLEGKRPNIIFLLTDDQGYGDISAHGNPILKTPNLDRLRSESRYFEDFHVSPTCSPTRSALMTGRHEFANGVTHTILERERLTLRATTVAEVLKKSGYTTGIFGKWHLGDEREYQPGARGFDETFIHGAGGIGQVYPGSCGDSPGNKYFDPVILHNDRFVKTKGYCTDVFYGQAIKWIDAQRKADKPFFAYIPSNAPHGPYIARPEDSAIYQNQTPNPQLASFYGMIHNIDENVGKLLEKLAEWGIDRNTLVIFMNDNGTAAGHTVYRAGMRGNKGTAWLGGTRASSFWRWPGTIKPGPSTTLTAHIDFFPTLAELAGVKLSDELKTQVKGRSLVPLLNDPASNWSDRLIITHVGRWPKKADPDEHKYKMAAIRNQRWSLVTEAGAKEPMWKLYDLTADYEQTTDVAEKHPEIVGQLAKSYDEWWSAVRPEMINENVTGPKLNPFAVMYWKQFGGGPTAEDYARMDPTRPWPDTAAPNKKASAKKKSTGAAKKETMK
jgi:arylsulfatase A-like enzyme